MSALPRALMVPDDVRRRVARAVVREMKSRAALSLAASEPVFRGAALEAQTATDRELVLSGPAGTGKSIALLQKLHTIAETYPRARCLMLRKTRKSLTESAMVTFEEKVLPPSHPVRYGASGQLIERKNRSGYRYANGSTIVTGGMDEASRLFSTEWDVVYWQELTEGSLDEWEKLLRSLRNNRVPYQQLLADCNPDVPWHWVKQRADEGRTRLLCSWHKDNPAYWDAERGEWTAAGEEYVNVTLASLTGVRRDRLYLGKWVAAEGLVYEDFSAETHVLDASFAIPPFWRRIRSVDFGFRNPFACQWWAIDPDDRMYLYRELYRTGRTVKAHAEDINRLSEGERIEATICDHDLEDRATLEENGIETTAAHKTDKKAGLQTVREGLKVQADGKPAIYLVRDALVEVDQELRKNGKPISTEQEFTGYSLQKGVDGRPLKEEPLEIDNHGMDAMLYARRYVVDTAAGGQLKTFRRPERRLRGVL